MAALAWPNPHGELVEASQYQAPRSIEDTIALLSKANGNAKVLAGGTDLLVRLRSGFDEPDLVVDIKRIDGMNAITAENGGGRVGAAVSGAELGEHDGVKAAWPGVVEAAELIGSNQIQGRASIGGNLCNASPAADGLPVLLVLEAEVELASRSGRRRLPVAEFVTGNRQTELRADELAVALHVPRPPRAAASDFLKLGSRHYLVIAIAAVAGLIALDEAGAIAEARIAVGACSPVARRLEALEAGLLGRSAVDDVERLIRATVPPALSPIDDARGSAAYRLEAAAVLVRRLLARAAEGREAA